MSNIGHTIARTFAPSIRNAVGAFAVAAAVGLSAAPAHAQFGGRASFGEAFQPDILQRDITLMMSTLGLEEWQRPVIEALLQDYMTGFTTGVEALKDRMKQASMDATKSAGTNGDAILDKVMAPINSWRDEKRRMQDKFMADVKSQLGPQQLERWPSFERAMRRERLLPGGDLSGESVDLWAAMARLQLTPAESEAVKPALSAYEVMLDEALANRQQRMLKLEPEIQAAMTSMDYSRGADLGDKIMALRIAVRSANDLGIETIAAAIGERGPMFRRFALEAGYPEVYRPHPVMILMQQARALESLTAEQGSQIDALMAEFATACDAQNAKLYEAVRTEEPKAPRKRVQAMVDRKSASGASTPQGGNSSDPVVAARLERERMGEPFRERLLAILSPEQRSELPGAINVEGAPTPKAAPKSTRDGVSTSHTPASGRQQPVSESQIEPDSSSGVTERPVPQRRDQRGAAGKGMPPLEQGGKPN
jgi:hypothetical protein